VPTNKKRGVETKLDCFAYLHITLIGLCVESENCGSFLRLFFCVWNQNNTLHVISAKKIGLNLFIYDLGAFGFIVAIFHEIVPRYFAVGNFLDTFSEFNRGDSFSVNDAGEVSYVGVD
jgi:hypothetical protein